MLKKILLVILLLLLGGAAYLWFIGGDDLYELYDATSPATVDRDYALQDDSRVTLPPLETAPPPAANPLKNVYWGELHVHTVESLDAVLFGTTLGIEDAYLYARGKPLRSDGGELMQLSRPLDFVAITDHAEGFGTRVRCNDEGLPLAERFHCWMMTTPNVTTFILLAAMAGGSDEGLVSNMPAGVYERTARVAPAYTDVPICAQDEDGGARCLADSAKDWQRYRELADRYNEPGVFTTFAAYEFSPALPRSGKHHRNVIFNGSALPEHAVSSLDVPNAVELWRELERNCSEDCDFLTIPHNMNKAWGLFYSPYTWDGQAYDEEAWHLRKRYEPLAEIYQVKGASECALGVGASDEECGFGQVLPPCEQGQVVGCAFETSFARQGLKVGLELEREYGFNPMAFGFIGATDSHNASPGDAEEWDFVGKVASLSSPAVRRMREWPDREPFESTLQFHTGGGLAAVWAEENTRDAIFSGMQRREAYATSGTRINLRFFAGHGFDESLVGHPDAVELATRGGVPMGGELLIHPTNPASPAFFVWAGADLQSAPLQRIQIVKGWIDGAGQTHERVRDIACGDSVEVDPDTGRCPDNGATVDLSDCSVDTTKGASEVAVVWRDPDFEPGQRAFYYARVLQNPTCRWSTYDSLRLGREPPAHVPATIRERAWSSPIWLQLDARPPLDLSVPNDLVGSDGVLTRYDDTKLPDLFTEEEVRARRLRGKLLLEEDAPLTVDKLKGAEIEVQVPIN